MRMLSSTLCAALVLGSAMSVPAGGPVLAFELSRGAGSGTRTILPEDKPVEPVLILVSLRDQAMRVFEGDRLVGRSNVSTGKAGHRTPTGIFSILEKRRYHESNIYSQAPMPFMQRLTWSGIALHESDSVPDYPASHGCVRLPGRFAKQLFGFTDRGAHVLVTDESVAMQPVAHPNLIYPGGAPANMSVRRPSRAGVMKTSIQTSGSTSVIRVVAPGNKAQTPAGSGSPSVIEINFEMRSSIDAVAPPPAEETEKTAEAKTVAADPREPIRILITRRTGQHLVADIQDMLNELGHEAGDADGLMGPETGNAIIAYQKSRDLSPTGTASVALAEMLHAETGRGAFPAGHLYVRQGFKPLFDEPVVLRDPAAPLGTHFLAALSEPGSPDRIRWIHTELSDTPRPSPLLELDAPGHSSFVQPVSVYAALDRIDLATELRERLVDMLAPGSSLIVTDNGLSNESHLGTDFIVLTRSRGSD